MSRFSLCVKQLSPCPCLSVSVSLLPFLLFGISVASGETGQHPAKGNHTLVYIGTYTGPKSNGIYLYQLDLGNGSLTSLGLAAEVINPSFLAIHPNHRFLYAVSETSSSGGKKGGAVEAFAIQETGKLTPLNQEPSGGEGPCYLVVDKTGRDVLVANYDSGSVSVLPVQQDGKLGASTAFVQHQGSSADPQRQEGPHAHSINVDAANRFAFAADLGLDKVLVYRFDPAKGTLVANDPPSVSVKPGAGPRHFAFHPGGHYAFVINEMGSTVTAFSYDPAHGVLKELQTISTLPENFKGENSTAEVQVHASGKFLYGSNRGHDSIAVFAIDPGKGTLSLVEHQSTQGKTPRNFGIDPSGQYLLAANQDSGTVVVFRISPQSGHLTPTGQVVEVPSPVCVKFLQVN
jgi:6-phosphogluconolactonase